METPTSIDYISIDHSQRSNNDDWPTAATGGVGGGLVGWLGGLIERRNVEESKVGPLLCEYKNNVFTRNSGRFNRVYVYVYIVLAAVCIIWLGAMTLFIYTHHSWNGSDDKPVFPEPSKYEKLSIQRVRTVDYPSYDNGKPLSNIPYSVEMSLNKNMETWDRPPLIWMWEERDFEEEFGKFAALHNKSYDSKEEVSIRYRIFKKNMYFIYSHNMRDKSYKVRMNQFGDMTFDEFRSAYMGLRHTTRAPGLGSYLGADLNLTAFKEEDLPDKVDWRAKGCVTEVKDQKKCGSCWAFSVTGSLEGAYCAKTGTLLSLSEQELIDCSGLEGNMGCNGGVMDSGFKYVIDNKGMMCTESEYPYLAKQQKKCLSKKCANDKELNIQGYKDVPPDNERALRAAVATYGSISVAIQADQPGFQFYSGGIYEGDCGTSLDHGVLVVGYGTEKEEGKPHDEKKDFFIIKNSWGKGWGEDGYIRLGRAKIKEGECGILMAPSYPVVGNTK